MSLGSKDVSFRFRGTLALHALFRTTPWLCMGASWIRKSRKKRNLARTLKQTQRNKFQLTDTYLNTNSKPIFCFSRILVSDLYIFQSITNKNQSSEEADGECFRFFQGLMIENSSIEIGCIYFFQITINVFSSSSLQFSILGRLK